MRGGKNELNKMVKNKSPGNDDLTKKFYIVSWDHIKVSVLRSLKIVFLRRELSVSKKQAVLKRIEKESATKRL